MGRWGTRGRSSSSGRVLLADVWWDCAPYRADTSQSDDTATYTRLRSLQQLTRFSPISSLKVVQQCSLVLHTQLSADQWSGSNLNPDDPPAQHDLFSSTRSVSSHQHIKPSGHIHARAPNTGVYPYPVPHTRTEKARSFPKSRICYLDCTCRI